MISYTQKHIYAVLIALQVYVEMHKRDKTVWLDLKMEDRDDETVV